jgi:folate-dependent phosphoribosylglycinamide formyltransferase PurN
VPGFGAVPGANRRLPMIILILGPRKRNERIVSFLERRGHRVLIEEAEIHVTDLERREIDFLISNGYAPIIRPAVIAKYAGKIINIHPSYLPYGRGIAGNFWSFVKNSPKGVSLHFIDPGIDTGNILFRRKVEMSPDDTLRTSLDKLMAAVEELFFENWERIAANQCSPLAQAAVPEEGTYHNRRQTERLIELLPDLWDSPVSTVEKMAADIFMSRQCWTAIDAEILKVDP